MQFLGVLLLFVLLLCEVNSEVQSSKLKNKCEFTQSLASNSFEYRCVKGSFDEKCELPDDIVQPNFDEVTHLKITDCPLEIVKKSFKKYKNLQSIDLSHSGYDSLDWLSLNHDHLVKLPDLKVLDVSNNEIESIENCFRNATKLEKVYLSNNEITSLNEIFQNHTKLNEVHLKNNPLLRDFTNISVVDVANNQLLDTQDIIASLNETLTYLFLEISLDN